MLEGSAAESRAGSPSSCGSGVDDLMAGIVVVAEARRGELREVSLEADRRGARVKEAAGGPLAVALIDATRPTHRAGAGLGGGVDEC